MLRYSHRMFHEKVLPLIPHYLVIMRKDKLRTCYGEKMEEISDSDMFKGRKFDE